MSHNRQWMYSPYENGLLRDEFENGIKTFIKFASSQTTQMDGEKIKCPCKLRNCRNTRFLDPYIIRSHLIKYGFVPNYYTWIYHGETAAPIGNQTVDDEKTNLDGGEEAASTLPHTNVINDVATPQLNVENNEEEHPILKQVIRKHQIVYFVPRLWGMHGIIIMMTLTSGKASYGHVIQKGMGHSLMRSLSRLLWRYMQWRKKWLINSHHRVLLGIKLT